MRVELNQREEATVNYRKSYFRPFFFFQGVGGDYLKTAMVSFLRIIQSQLLSLFLMFYSKKIKQRMPSPHIAPSNNLRPF